jgi:predicted flap endonuclease-1-like 5' DNA nuclease
MPLFTVNQWVVLALVFVLGWLLGARRLAGVRKWRTAFEAERQARITADIENTRLGQKLAELESERERRIAIEKERDSHIAPTAAAADTPIVEPETRRAFVNPDMTAPAPAASGSRDDLSMIFGVGRAGEIKLNALGIHRFVEIITLSLVDEAALESKIGLAPGTIADERWRDQAEMLRKGKYDDHARMFA